MPGNPLVLDLVEEILESDRDPADVCSEHPELLGEVRRQLKRARNVEARLAELFPSSHDEPAADWKSQKVHSQNLPEIPGYQLEEMIGQGGMGIVFRARHLGLNRLIALKMLLSGVFASRQEITRFIREAEAVAALQHPNIVEVHDVGEFERRPYFTMELLSGGSLAQKLGGAPQPARESAQLVATLAAAVAYAHEHGIVHRDLKPANILLTAADTPKIADFGLARRVDAMPDLTMTGARLGTPSYMAPEQAIGKASLVGPAVDIYALGAILYEMLTGRPPFRADTAAETERQVIVEEPARPSRLNASVPRDLETICLKCLHKDPQRRYASASDLAADLHRFLENRPILARPVASFERLFKWARRNPASAITLSGVVVATLAMITGAWWWMAQHAVMEQAVDGDIHDAGMAAQQSAWADARTALERANIRLGTGGSSSLRRRVEQCAQELEIVERLDEIRLNRVTRGELVYYKVQADRDYDRAFRSLTIRRIDDDPERAVTVIKGTAARGAIVAALEDWSVCAPDREHRAWLLDVARRVGSDLNGWRKKILTPEIWDDPAALADATQSLRVKGLPVSLLLAVGERLRTTGRDSIPFLKQVQRENPGDFWTNLILGNAILQSSPGEAISFYRAALAARPQVAVGYCGVGDALQLLKQSEEAIEYFEKALRIDSRYARAYSNLGQVLQLQDRLDEAIELYQKSLQFDPDYAWAHHNLGNALRVQGRFDEAFEQYQEVLRLDPHNLEIRDRICSVLLRMDRGREAQRAWQKALADAPPFHDHWFGYAELCLFLGDEDEYHRACGELIERFGNSTDPFLAERIGRACLLRPQSEAELRIGAELAERSVTAGGSMPEWVVQFFLFAKGLAEYRQGRLEGAISIMSHRAAHVLEPAPRLIVAMARFREGHVAEARRELAAAIGAFDWHPAAADNRDVLIRHILRREAEALIFPDLESVLRGERRPSDNEERLALLGTCQFRELHATAAGLYADAFAADPSLAEDLLAGRRYRAACCAVSAGCGGGADAGALDDAARHHWRRQARDWLHADLAAWSATVADKTTPDRAAALAPVARWRDDPALAQLRAPAELAKLPADEREECRALWNEVDALLKRSATPE